MTDPARHMRLLRPAPDVLAFYDGRIDGQRFAAGANWVDDGALSLGIASYAVLGGDHALVYDTHVSRPHALRICDWLRAEGVRRITVVLSHCHLDHIAGTAEFVAQFGGAQFGGAQFGGAQSGGAQSGEAQSGGCEIIANARTMAHLTRERAAIEAGTLSGLPAIAPLVLPTRVFSGEAVLRIGQTEVRAIEANIHSDDATVLYLPQSGLLLAGDTVEDTVTYVGDPAAFAIHLADLARLAALNPRAILPNHGAEAIIAAGGYPPSLLSATDDYIRWLMELRGDGCARDTPLRQAIAAQLAAGDLTWFAPYERVHAQNIARTLEHYRGAHHRG